MPEVDEQETGGDLPVLSDSMLYLDGVSVSFDGFKALNSLSLVLGKGELRTIIGPNGAGKTTMMDVITGKTRPDSGEVIFQGRHDLTKLDEAAIATLGIGRKFQKPSVFEALTVLQNLELALQGPWSLTALLAKRLDGAQRARIERALMQIGFVMLDEPVAGMTDAETEKTAELIHTLKGHHTILVVEHDMTFVAALGAKVTVLHEGRVLAEGPLEMVQQDPTVIEVYLGR
jgi:urea transport system ATP-binding protein